MEVILPQHLPQLAVDPATTFLDAGETLHVNVNVNVISRGGRAKGAQETLYMVVHVGAQVVDESRGIALPLQDS